ncbi:MAG: hypothetical protein K8T26_02585 [Lentisphaerae bacterium]|nr:hypothetical protein [Lentisphaerota bacterium]
MKGIVAGLMIALLAVTATAQSTSLYNADGMSAGRVVQHGNIMCPKSR